MTVVVEPAKAAKPRRRATDNKWVQRAIVWGALLVIYELLAIALGDFYLATIKDIVGGFIQVVEDGRLKTVGESLEHLLVGFALAAAVGIPVGVAQWAGLSGNGSVSRRTPQQSSPRMPPGASRRQ